MHAYTPDAPDATHAHVAHLARLAGLTAVALLMPAAAKAADTLAFAAASAASTAAAVGAVSAPATEADTRPWTAARLSAAKPFMPRAGYLPPAAFDFNAAMAEAATTVPAVSVRGSRGGADAKGLREKLELTPYVDAETGGIEDRFVTESVGSGAGAINFTSTRSFPNAADTTYPTRAIGKLYFSEPGVGDFICSGAMIKPGVVVTSGHCVHNGTPAGKPAKFYTNFTFVPGLRNSTFPYGRWSNWTQVRTTTAWINGRGAVPNSGDWALIVFGPNASGGRIGNYTGWLGYQTSSCSGKHLTTVGYPANLDGGLQMHRVDSQANNYGSVNNCIWGSDMTGGSSGGPVVLNLRVPYTNTSTQPLDNADNRIVSTVSWGYTDPSRKLQAGSVFDGNFVNLLNATCASSPGAC